MLEIASIVGLSLLAAGWAADRARRWSLHRARLVEQIAELTAHSQVLQENSSQAIVKFETTGIIRTVNPAAEELFGYPAYELVGQNIMRLVPGALLASRLNQTVEIQCRDGSLLRVPFKAAKSEPARLPYIYLFLDRRPELAAAPAAPAPVQQPLSYAAGIVGRIAGQFETLLTTINGYSELALLQAPERDRGAPHDRDLQEMLEEILTASSRASSLTRHLVAFSGSQFIPVEPLDLNRLVKDMQPQLRRAVRCPIDFDLQPMDLPSLANVECLQQMILLLCDSARARMRETDRLQVRTRLCDLTEPSLLHSGELKPGTYAVLTISDSGHPLTPQIQEHLFEPLALLHEDIGVELSPIYGIVQSLGGGIEIETGDGIGTTFQILLPCQRAQAAAVASNRN